MPVPQRSAKSPRIASVPVVVSDRAAAKTWYTQQLGLDLIDDDDHWVTVGRKGEGAVLHLCPASENSPALPLEPGPSGVVLVLPGDFRAECARLEAAGVEFSHRPEEAPWGWFALVRDPDGNEHNLAPER